MCGFEAGTGAALTQFAFAAAFDQLIDTQL